MLPKIFSFGKIALYSYPLMMGIAWGVSYLLTQSLLAKYQAAKNFRELFWGVFISAWVGAKIFFLLFSSKNYSLGMESSFWLGGGFVFYGGLVFSLIFLLIYSFILKRFEFKQIALFVPGVAFGHAIGRIGCFLAGCCYGSATSCSLAVHLHGDWRHPVQLYESFLVAIIGIVALLQIRRRVGFMNIILTYLMGYSFCRFLLEFIRGDQIRGILLFGLSTSQFIALLIFISALVIIMIGKVRGYRENLYKNRR